MKRLIKWLAVGIVILLVFTYAMYAWSYQGNYNVAVTVPVRGSSNPNDSSAVSASQVTLDSQPTDFWEFWSTFSSMPSVGSGAYVLYCEFFITAGGAFRHFQSQAFDIATNQVLSLTFHYKDVEPGQGTVHVYIMDQTLTTKLYDHTWTVTVG